MHALLGQPRPQGLFCDDARERIICAFDWARAQETIRPECDRLLNAWWGELCDALNSGIQAEGDVGMLWKTFSETCKAQCKAAARLSQEDKQGRNAQRREHLKQACRDFLQQMWRLRQYVRWLPHADSYLELLTTCTSLRMIYAH